jgi:hypothetical protein
VCAYYWNLTATFTCPACGSVHEDANLQTHYGDGYCTYYVKLGERADWLGDLSITLGADGPDDFIASCDCGAIIDFAARIENGAVIRVWPYQYSDGGVVVEVPA